MLTLEQAQGQGYTLTDQEDGSVEVTRNGDHVITIHSDCPHFFALRYIAGIVGDDLASTVVTADLVQQTTGETYVEPVLPPPTPPLADAIQQAVGSVPDDGTVADLKTAILNAIATSTGN